MEHRQTEEPPSYESVVKQNTSPPPYPTLQALPTQIQPYYIPQTIPHTPYVVQTVPPEIRQVPPRRSKSCRYGGSSAYTLIVVLIIIGVWLGVHYGQSLWGVSEKDNKTDVCAPSAVVCDGIRDCPEGSDESSCVRFGEENELQVMTSKAESFLPVCAHGWNKNLADQTCQQLGFRESYEDGVLTTNSSIFLNVFGRFSNTIQGSGNISASCPGQQTVSLWCSDCGTPSLSTRIIGGTGAADGQWPWQASLHFNDHPTCGGSLVAPDFVITAAHCFPKESPSTLLPTNWHVYIGIVSQHQLPNPHHVKQIIVNENYDPDTKNNDIAILKLTGPANNIHPVCLPVFGQAFSSSSQCWTTGFGVTKEGSESGSVYLMEIAINLIDSAVCNQPAVYDGLITETMQCAGDLRGGKDTCQGDSGGPLVCKDGDRWYLTGVTSWGDGCGKKNRPGVYSNVSHLTTWIQGRMQQNRP